MYAMCLSNQLGLIILIVIESCMEQIRACIGSIPIIDDSADSVNGEYDASKDKSPSYAPQNRVLADGTYATESAYSTNKKSASSESLKPFYRQPLRGMDFSV